LLLGLLGERAWGLPKPLPPDLKVTTGLGLAGLLKRSLAMGLAHSLLIELTPEPGKAIALAPDPDEGLRKTGIGEQARLGEPIQDVCKLLGGFGMGGELAGKLKARVLSPSQKGHTTREQ
jgi:hypothetical protein